MSLAGEIRKRKMLLRDFQNGLTAQQSSNRIEEKFGGRGYRVRSVQRWFSKFRSGDFSLEFRSESGQLAKSPLTTPRNEPKKPASKKSRPKRVPQKEVKVNTITFKQEPKKSESRAQTSSVKSEAVQKLIQRKPELTVSKVNGGLGVKSKPIPNCDSKLITKSSPVSTTKATDKRPPPEPPVAQKKQRLNGPPTTMPKLRPHGLEADLKLPLSIAKRMTSPPTLTERHSISEGRKTALRTVETVKKPITVQFQNVNPDVAKNTVRKVSETPSVQANRRSAIPQSTPLSLPKGVIYLNPQEIFRQSFGSPSTQQRSGHIGPFPKVIGNLPKVPLLTPKSVAPPEVTRLSEVAQTTVLVSDSDSEDDLVFPEDIRVPPPKVKVVAETFTTYWDMETDKPILLNPAEDPIPPNQPVIEID